MHDDLATRARIALGAGALLILFGVWLGNAWWFYALAGIALVVAIGRTRRCGLPTHVALAIGAVGLIATGLAFENGPSFLGGLLAGLIAAGTFMAATLDSCVPCELFALLFERETRRLSADDEPTVQIPNARLPGTPRIRSAAPLPAHSTRA